MKARLHACCREPCRGPGWSPPALSCTCHRCSWRLGPILAAVIVASVCTAFLYRRQTRALEATSAAAQQRLAEVASSSFANMRTVRIFAGEALEQQRFGQQVARSYASGLGFARAKAMLEGGARALLAWAWQRAGVSVVSLPAISRQPANAFRSRCCAICCALLGVQASTAAPPTCRCWRCMRWAGTW